MRLLGSSFGGPHASILHQTVAACGKDDRVPIGSRMLFATAPDLLSLFVDVELALQAQVH